MWSSAEGFYTNASFEPFARAGATLHIDTDEMEAQAHFATADVFVMGRSCFSLLPALLNPNCVVATVHGSNKMTDEALVRAVPHGMALSGGRAGEELLGCMRERGW